MFRGKTTEQLRAERDADDETVAAAAGLAKAIVEQYPGEDRAVELSELDDYMRIANATDRRAEIVRWLEENEPEAWDQVSTEEEEGFLGAFENAFRDAVE